MQSFCLTPQHFDIVTFAGPDTTKFLQGQLTCDVQNLPAGSATWGAACNNKGRVHATFLLVREQDAHVMVLAGGLGEILAGNLRKFLPFYKCTMELNLAGWRCTGMTGTQAADKLSAKFGVLPQPLKLAPAGSGWICTLSTTTNQYLWYTHDGISAPLPSDIDLPHGSPEQWQVLEMQSGRFPFTPVDTGLYTPQELHLDRNGYLNFSKGCYTGQEIIARMHYRGKPKKQLYLIELAGRDHGAHSGSFDISDDNGTILGHTLKQITLGPDGPTFALAQLPIEFAGMAPALWTSTRKPVALLPF